MVHIHGFNYTTYTTPTLPSGFDCQCFFWIRSMKKWTSKKFLILHGLGHISRETFWGLF